MNASELAQKMLEWELKRKELDALESVIKSAVLEIGKTQNVGMVRASYTNGRHTFDYETPGKSAPEGVIADYTKTVTTVTTDWKMVCEIASLEPFITGQSAPSVSIKLME